MKISERAALRRPRCPVCDTPQDGPDDRRSVPHLRRFFALVKAALAHWPESHERQFSNVDELRAFLLIKAKHREIAASIPLAGIPKARALLLVESAFRATGSYAFAVSHGGNIVIFKPRSIAFAKLSHLAAVGLFHDVEDVIREETGLDPVQLMKEHEAAA